MSILWSKNEADALFFCDKHHSLHKKDKYNCQLIKIFCIFVPIIALYFFNQTLPNIIRK